MGQSLKEVILENWPRKLVAVLSAFVIWFFVNHAIVITKTFVNVPVHVVNIPQDMTIEGLMQNGIMSKRLTLTITGHRHILEELDSMDLEVRIDATERYKPFIAKIGKKSVVSLDESINLSQHISKVEQAEILLKPSRLVTAKVPVRIPYPNGEPPHGYQYLDVWPQQLTHTISGPEHLVEELQQKGIVLKFDLGEISKDELDRAQVSNVDGFKDEVRIPFPVHSKFISIPFHSSSKEELNDPEAKNMTIDFLRKEILPLGKEVPIRVYFRPKYSDQVNPNNLSLEENKLVIVKNGLYMLNQPVYVSAVSRLFLDIVGDQIEIVVIANPKENEPLNWSVEFHNIQDLENEYVRRMLGGVVEDNSKENKRRIEFMRTRFRDYVRRFELLKENEKKLGLDIRIYGNQIRISEMNQ
jgi:hypothetical protein